MSVRLGYDPAWARALCRCKSGMHGLLRPCQSYALDLEIWVDNKNPSFLTLSECGLRRRCRWAQALPLRSLFGGSTPVGAGNDLGMGMGALLSQSIFPDLIMFCAGAAIVQPVRREHAGGRRLRPQHGHGHAAIAAAGNRAAGHRHADGRHWHLHAQRRQRCGCGTQPASKLIPNSSLHVLHPSTCQAYIIDKGSLHG